MPTKKAKQPEAPAPERTTLDPKRVHELLSMPGPYSDVPEPPGWPDRETVWDPGMSILELFKRFPGHFLPTPWFTEHPFAKLSETWCWRQFRTDPVLPGNAYATQLEKLPKGDGVPAARQVVAWLLVHFLTTGTWRETVRLRCRDLMPSGRRVVVSSGPRGIDLANVSDYWTTPNLGLASAFVPPVKAKKK